MPKVRNHKGDHIADTGRALTLHEISLLTRCLLALTELEAGKRAPRTTMQRRFLLVCRGALPATTNYERAYLKWRESRVDLELERQRLRDEAEMARLQEAKKRAYERQRVRELKKIERQAEERLAIDLKHQRESVAKRKVEEWGAREAWKRDRGSWRR